MGKQIRTKVTLDRTYTTADVVEFAWQRHRAWWGGDVTDPVVASARFTNVFRVLDRGSQYLLKLMYTHDNLLDVLALAYLYRQINRPESMEALIERGGTVPGYAEVISSEWMHDVLVPVAVERTGKFLNRAYTIFVIPGDPRPAAVKMAELFPVAGTRLPRVASASTLRARYQQLVAMPGLGPFLAMQIATDMGYSAGEADQENTFIQVGPGSRKGISYVTDAAPEHYLGAFPTDELPTMPGSNGRPPSLMDLQNLFCEFDKLLRYRQLGKWKLYRPHEQPLEALIPAQFVRP